MIGVKAAGAIRALSRRLDERGALEPGEKKVLDGAVDEMESAANGANGEILLAHYTELDRRRQAEAVIGEAEHLDPVLISRARAVARGEPDPTPTPAPANDRGPAAAQ